MIREPMSMPSGALRKQVQLQQEVQADDGGGGYALSWATVATLWAGIEPVNGAERFVYGHIEGSLTHKITLRWRPDIAPTADMRVLYGARSFNIRAAINPGERDRCWILLTTEGSAV